MTLEAQSRLHEKVAGGVLVQFLTLTFTFFFVELSVPICVIKNNNKNCVIKKKD